MKKQKNIKKICICPECGKIHMLAVEEPIVEMNMLKKKCENCFTGVVTRTDSGLIMC